MTNFNRCLLSYAAQYNSQNNSRVKCLEVLEWGKNQWTAARFVQAFSFYDKCMICFDENEENTHFCTCHQSLTIKNSLGKRSGVAIQNCAYC